MEGFEDETIRPTVTDKLKKIEFVGRTLMREKMYLTEEKIESITTDKKATASVFDETIEVFELSIL